MSWWYTLRIILWDYSQLDFDVLYCCWCTWDYWRRCPLRPKSWSSIYYEVNSIFWIFLCSTLDEKHFRDHKWVVNSIAKKKVLSYSKCYGSCYSVKATITSDERWWMRIFIDWSFFILYHTWYFYLEHGWNICS